MGKVYTRFQTKTEQKPPTPDGAAHTYMAYIREYPPPPPPYPGLLTHGWRNTKKTKK